MKKMNGLEAIEFMKQGGLVIEVGVNEPFILKIENGIVWSKNITVLGGEWLTDDCFDFTIDYEEYIEPKPLTGWERVGENESYYNISCNCYVEKLIEERCMEDKYYYEDANYFSTEEKAEEINFKQTLFRKLQRFSDENGGNENERRYYIVYNSFTDEIKVNYSSYLVGVSEVRFTSKETAQQAIELFKEDLVKYFTM